MKTLDATGYIRDLPDPTSGAAFPTGAALTAYGDDRPFFRTDLGESYYHHGTRWLSSTIYLCNMELAPVVTTATNYIRVWSLPHGLASDIFVVGWTPLVNVATPNDGSHYWWVEIDGQPSGATIDAYSTAAQGVGAWYSFHRVLANLMGADIFVSLQVFRGVGTAGNISLGCVIEYCKVST
jgi:hypothetical protein